MFATGFPEAIGFTEEECRLARGFYAVVGEETEAIARAYMHREIEMVDVCVRLQELTKSGLHNYTLNLLFLLSCTGYLEETYREKGLYDAFFIETMKDLKYKLDECKQTKGVFGNFVLGWYHTFFRGNLMSYGRLQFRTEPNWGEEVTVLGKTFGEGTVMVDCHIPASGPLTRESLLDAYRKAYDAFPEYRIGNILPIHCFSWLLYPGYEEVFSVSANITGFRRDFCMYGGRESETFEDSWRVFGKETDDPDSLPENTSLQRAFKTYMEQGGSFGYGRGLILFDGEKVVHETLVVKE